MVIFPECDLARPDGMEDLASVYTYYEVVDNCNRTHSAD